MPGALTALADLSARYAERGDSHVEVVLDRARVLLVAGLSAEAIGVIETASDWVSTRPRARAELLVMRASARLGQGQPELALADARAARQLFVRQHRDWWRTRADLVALQARIELGRGSRRAAVALADSLATDRTEDGVLAALLAGRELARSDPAGASTYLSRAALGRHRGNPLSRPPRGWRMPSTSRCRVDRACCRRWVMASTHWPSTALRSAVPSCAP